MYLSRLALMAVFMICGAIASQAIVSSQTDTPRGEIIALVEASYINGAFNDLDTNKVNIVKVTYENK